MANDAVFLGVGAVSIDAAGALTGDGSSGSPLAVNVDETTVTVNGSNALETIGATAGPFTTVSSITVANGLVTALTGS